jgi:hypothetical protein
MGQAWREQQRCREKRKAHDDILGKQRIRFFRLLATL